MEKGDILDISLEEYKAKRIKNLVNKAIFYDAQGEFGKASTCYEQVFYLIDEQTDQSLVESYLFNKAKHYGLLGRHDYQIRTLLNLAELIGFSEVEQLIEDESIKAFFRLHRDEFES